MFITFAASGTRVATPPCARVCTIARMVNLPAERRVARMMHGTGIPAAALSHGRDSANQVGTMHVALACRTMLLVTSNSNAHTVRWISHARDAGADSGRDVRGLDQHGLPHANVAAMPIDTDSAQCRAMAWYSPVGFLQAVDWGTP
jgi:hypothetical protein